MVQYNTATIQKFLMGIIFILSIAIIGLWRLQPPPLTSSLPASTLLTSKGIDVSHHAANAHPPAGIAPTTVSTNQPATASAKPSTASSQSVSYDFYNLLSEPQAAPIDPKNANNTHHSTAPTSTPLSAAMNNSKSKQNGTATLALTSNSQNAHATYLNSTHPTTPAVAPPKVAGLSMQDNLYYSLQVAALQDYTTALRVKQQLTQAGYPVYLQSYQNKTQQWYRVMVGPYAGKDPARLMQQQLGTQRVNSLLIPVPTQTR